MSEMNRRSFLRAGSLCGIAGITAGASALARAAEPTCPVLPKWDESVDVLIVGSGFAGLAAALVSEPVRITRQKSRQAAKSSLRSIPSSAACEPLENPEKERCAGRSSSAIVSVGRFSHLLTNRQIRIFADSLSPRRAIFYTSKRQRSSTKHIPLISMTF